MISHALFIHYIVTLKSIKKFYQVINENLSKFVFNKSTQTQGEELQKIWYLRYLHTLVSKLSEDISDFYSLPMLLGLPNSFFALIGITYQLTKPIVLGHFEISTCDLINLIAYVSPYAFNLVNLTKTVTDTIKEVI